MATDNADSERGNTLLPLHMYFDGARCSSVVRVFAHGAIGRRIDPSWWTH